MGGLDVHYLTIYLSQNVFPYFLIYSTEEKNDGTLLSSDLYFEMLNTMSGSVIFFTLSIQLTAKLWES